MAGLWCVNIGYGRAAKRRGGGRARCGSLRISRYSADEPCRAAALAERINGLMGRGYHTYFVLGLRGERGRLQDRPPVHEARASRALSLQDNERDFSYHGTTLATLDVVELGERKAKFEPYSGDFVHVAHPYCYRCPFGLEYPSCGLACVKSMETTILGEGPETVAEALVEPIMSGVGVAVPPDEYRPRWRSFAASTASFCTSTR